MCVEIEAKLRVESLEVVARRLAKVGGEFECEQTQRDYYFDDSNGSMRQTDKCLRIRSSKAAGQEKIFIAFKGARENGRFKRRREIEFEVSDFEAAGRLLNELGLKNLLVVEKKRDLWRLKGCEVCLDEVAGLGSFVEIEGSDENVIEKVQRLLELGELKHITESYAGLLLKKQAGEIA